MVIKLDKANWVRIGRSGRRKRLISKSLIAIFLGTFTTIVITLWLLSNYTNWILHRDYVKEKDALIKTWIPGFSFFLGSFQNVLTASYPAIVNVVSASEPHKKSTLPTIRIWLENNGLEKLNSGIFQYGMGFLEKKPRVKGFYQFQKKSPLPIAVSLRGVMPYHHMVWKPSIRIKFNKETLVDGFRNHLLVSPKDGIGFRNWLSDYLGKRWDFLYNGNRFIRLFANDKYMGVYNQLWRYDESFFIQSRRIPTAIFRLEHFDKREFFRKWQVWYRREGWKIIGENIKKGQKQLEKLLDISNNLVFLKPYEKNALIKNTIILNQYIDGKKFAQYLALLCHAGETHVDDRHNNAFFIDPVSGKLTPILEDITGYGFPGMEKEQIERPILKKEGAFVNQWLKDPFNLALFIEHLYELVLSFGSEKTIDKVIKNKWDEVRPAAISDINMSIINNQRRAFFPLTKLEQSIDNLIHFIGKRNRWINGQILSDKISVSSPGENNFEILVRGFSGVVVKRKDGNLIQTKGSQEANMSAKLLPSVTIIGKGSSIKLKNLPKAFAFYSLPGKPEDYLFFHRLTLNPLSFSPLPKNLETIRAISGIHPFELSEIDKSPVFLGPGEVIFTKTHQYNEGQPVVIRAGTQLKLGLAVSLVIKGPLLVQGTADQPVTVRPLDSEKPFGVMALIGEKTNHSRIHHLDIEGGSVHQLNNLELTGMFSIHDCPDVEIRNSRFGKNFMGDDTVHIMRSKTRVYDSTFENTNADAMDWDKVIGEVSNSLFLNTRINGLDLSLSEAKIISSRFKHCGDKCISAGEGSQASIINSNFQNCNIGVGVKDRSLVELSGNLISECKTGYSSYRKKWRWVKGGEGIIKDTHFLSSLSADVAGDTHSKVTFPKGVPSGLVTQGKIKIKPSIP